MTDIDPTANLDGTNQAPVVLVTLGTMHHPLERLMDWIEQWITEHPGEARFVVQHGASRLPSGAEGFKLCSREQMAQWNARSQVVVTQGGPGGIMDSRDAGIMPIAVPRRPDLNEVVDDHQERFCKYMAEAGLIRLATNEQEFRSQLEAALADPTALAVTVDRSEVTEAIERTGALIEDLVARRPSRFSRRR